MKTTLAGFSLLLLALTGNSVAADTFWADVSDALWGIHVEEEPADPLSDMLAGAGAVRSGLTFAAGPGATAAEIEVLHLTRGTTGFWLLSGGIDHLPVGYFLRFGPGDQRIPGLRGSVGNCFEGAAPTCRTRTVQHRTNYRLGEAVCQCGQAEVLSEGPDGAMIGLHCYFGRPGTYMSYLFGYGPVPQSAAVALAAEEPEGPLRQSLCSASGGPETGNPADAATLRQLAPRRGLFADALPVFVSVGRMGDDLQLDPKVIAQEVMVLDREALPAGSPGEEVAR